MCLLVMKMDAGPLVKQVEKDLTGDEKAGQILSSMFTVGSEELIKLLPSLWDGASSQNSTHTFRKV